MLHLIAPLLALVQLPLPGSPADSLAWQDFDRDGLDDLLVVPGSGALRLLRNRGDGTFEHLTGAFSREAPVTRQAVWGDLDGDGWSDLATLGLRGELRLFTNLSGTRFEERAVGLEARGVQGAASLRVLDFDGDRALDLSLEGPDGPRLLRNTGSAHFTVVELGDTTLAALDPVPPRTEAPRTERASTPTATGSAPTSGPHTLTLPPPPTVTSVTAVSAGVPSGYMILGDTPTAPAGYTATGLVVKQERWIDRGRMLADRWLHGAAAVGSMIYVCGGQDTAGILGTVEGYSLASNSWVSLAPMPTARTGVGAAAVGTKIYAVGGSDGTNILATVEEYDTATNSWTPRAPMLQTRNLCAVVALGGKVYALGGLDASSTLLATVEEYDPSTNTWTSKAPMPSSRIQCGAVALNGKLHVTGGYDNFGAKKELVVYDPGTDTWTLKTPPLEPRYAHTSAVLGNQLLILGGTPASLDERYDPGSDSWVRLATGASDDGMAAVNAAGRVFTTGGAGSSLGRYVLEFDPVVLYAFEKN